MEGRGIRSEVALVCTPNVRESVNVPCPCVRLIIGLAGEEEYVVGLLRLALPIDRLSMFRVEYEVKLLSGLYSKDKLCQFSLSSCPSCLMICLL